MEFLKEYFDGFLTRIRSPIFGSIMISFFLINWKAIYYLLFAEVPALERLAYVDKNTSSITAIAAPISLGIFIALILPYINWISAVAISFPVKRHRLLQVTETEELRRKKLNLEIALIDLESVRNGKRAETRAEAERKLADEAEFYKRVDPAAQRKITLQRALDPDSGMNDVERAEVFEINLTRLQRQLIQHLGDSQDSISVRSLRDNMEQISGTDTGTPLSRTRLQTELSSDLNKAMDWRLVEENDNQVKLTALGYKVSDIITKSNRKAR